MILSLSPHLSPVAQKFIANWKHKGERNLWDTFLMREYFLCPTKRLITRLISNSWPLNAIITHKHDYFMFWYEPPKSCHSLNQFIAALFLLCSGLWLWQWVHSVDVSEILFLNILYYFNCHPTDINLLLQSHTRLNSFSVVHIYSN